MLLPTLIAQQFGSFKPTSPLVEGAEENPGANLEAIISNVLGVLTIVGGIFFIIYFMVASFEWITAGGDAGKLTTARNKMMQGVLGLIVLVAAYGIIGLIGSLVGIELLKPAELLESVTPGTGT
ncbi:MAG: hypothetical protein BroJett025_10950 [Patescibacteria group bacterium]|nr:MAG: hypothetical protein BroJett025_10950 [Patescibacteria group bacterium]